MNPKWFTDSTELGIAKAHVLGLPPPMGGTLLLEKKDLPIVLAKKLDSYLVLARDFTYIVFPASS